MFIMKAEIVVVYSELEFPVKFTSKEKDHLYLLMLQGKSKQFLKKKKW